MVTKETHKRLGLGKKSSQMLSELAEKNKNIFTVDDAVAILKEKKSTVSKILHDLTRNKWLFRISKGKYLIQPLEAGVKPTFTEHEFIITANLIDKYYISYWSALNYYGLTEQVSKKIFVATTKRKKEKKIFGISIRFVTLKNNKFFGFKKVLINNFPVNIAEKEKVIIDCLDMPRNCGGIAEIAKAIDSVKDNLDFKKLIRYASHMGNFAIINRLGYILELLGTEIKIKPSKHYVLLDPLVKKKGTYNLKWRIIENVPKKELLSWREH